MACAGGQDGADGGAGDGVVSDGDFMYVFFKGGCLFLGIVLYVGEIDHLNLDGVAQILVLRLEVVLRASSRL